MVVGTCSLLIVVQVGNESMWTKSVLSLWQGKKFLYATQNITSPGGEGSARARARARTRSTKGDNAAITPSVLSMTYSVPWPLNQRDIHTPPSHLTTVNTQYVKSYDLYFFNSHEQQSLFTDVQ